MASTNKTTNYELSQFLGTDKPAWLSDYNTDMSKIDAQMKLNADGVTSASGASTANTTAIGTLANLTTDAKTNLVSAVNEVDSHADSAQTTANTASLNASTALNGLAKFDLDNEIPLTVVSNLGTVAENSLKIRKDDTNSVYKFYGQLTITGLTGVTGTITLTITPTSGLNPSEAYEVTCGSTIYKYRSGSGEISIGNRKFGVGTDGTITIANEPVNNDTSTITWIFPPCVYFNQGFGD